MFVPSFTNISVLFTKHGCFGLHSIYLPTVKFVLNKLCAEAKQLELRKKPGITGTSMTQGSFTSVLVPLCDKGPSLDRMFPKILLSTIFTLLTSLWCCIRPDSPSPHDSALRTLGAKLNIVFWVFICPEAVLFWAIRQWVEAGIVAKEFHGEYSSK